MKYSVGNRVRVRKDLKVGDSFNGICFVDDMKKYKREIHEVKEADEFHLSYSLNGCEYWRFTDEMLEPVETDQITINRYGNKVVAKMGKKVGVARCNETDTFNLYIGVSLAVDRLFGKESEFKNSEVKEVKRHAKVGEYIKIVRTTQGHIPNVFIGDIHKIKRVNSDGDAWSFENGFDYTEYVVLENYKPQEKPQEEKPKYYNGKVVCVKSKDISLTVGKIYVFKNGLSRWDNGELLPQSEDRKPFESFEDLQSWIVSDSKFIELVE